MSKCLETGHLLEGMGLVQMGWGSHLFRTLKNGERHKSLQPFLRDYSNYLSTKKKKNNSEGIKNESNIICYIPRNPPIGLEGAGFDWINSDTQLQFNMANPIQELGASL